MPRAKKPVEPPANPGVSASFMGGAVASGQRLRESLDNPNLGSFGNLIERQPDADNDWRSGCFDTSTLDRMPTADLLNLL
ncbi:MAG: hypothetical protein H0U60_02375, partial [Blastocatellia bacterium]|nr:hypothetical protein [Blastocatellia bacterium]